MAQIKFRIFGLKGKAINFLAMTISRELFFIALLLIARFSVDGQAKTELELLTRAEDFKIQERVLLTLDQDFYLAGESVNFFALTFDAALQIPIEFSSILYVELFNQDNNVINAKKFLLKRGEGIYYLNIPRQLETGYYYVRAYTNYMKNFGPGAFFTKRIKIVNPFYKIKYSNSAGNRPTEMRLNISAEGGSMLYGIQNKLAFHTSNANDSVLARLYKNDSIVGEVNTQNGFGIFNFTPTVNSNYKIEVVSVNRKKAVVELKNIVHSGVICKLDSLNNSDAYLNVITKNFDRFPLTVFVENNGILYEYTNIITQPETSLKIALPQGINRIIVKTSLHEVVSERLIYVKPDIKLKFTAKLDKPNAFQGDSVTLSIRSNTNDSIQYLVALNLGTSETSPPIQELIESSLFSSSLASLTDTFTASELHYISSNTRNINDYILKYQPAKPINARMEKIDYLPEIVNDIVTGSVRQLSDQSLAIDKSIYLAFIDSICWINRSKTDSFGKFTANVPFDYQGNNLIISVKDSIGSYSIRFDDEFYPDFLNVSKEKYFPDSSLRQTIESRMLNLQVNDAYAELRKEIKPLRSTLRFYGYPDSEYKFKKYVNLPNLEEFILEIVNRATIVKRKKKSFIKVLAKGKNEITGDNPMIIFDGIPIRDVGNLTAISSEKLESIRIVSDKFFFGTDIFDGIIDITSNARSFDLLDLDRNSTRVLFNPVISAKDNYQPQESRMPDYKSSIYFNRINSASGSEDIRMRLPQNSGNYSLYIFGYKKDGEWGVFQISNILKISH